MLCMLTNHNTDLVNELYKDFGYGSAKLVSQCEER
mgnify:FL=1